MLPNKGQRKRCSSWMGDLNLCKGCNQLRIAGDPTAVRNKDSVFKQISHEAGVCASSESQTSDRLKESVCEKDQEKLLLQPLLAYILFSMQAGTVEKIKCVILRQFTEKQVLEAKDALWDHCGSDVIGEKRRRNTTTSRSDAEANLVDIINALIKLDKMDKLPCVVIDAMSLGIIPHSHPEELNDITLCDRLNRMEERMKGMQSCMDNVLAQNLELKERVSSITSYATVASLRGATCKSSLLPSCSSVPENLELQSEKENQQLQHLGAYPKKPSTDNILMQHCEKSYGHGSTSRKHPQDPPTHNKDELDCLNSEAEKCDEYEIGFQKPKYMLKNERRSEARKRRVIVGSGPAASGSVQGAPEPERHLFIYCVSACTSTEDLKAHVVGHKFTVKYLQCISKEGSKFKSFRLSVPVSKFPKLFDSSLWPQGIRVRKFNISRRSGEDEQNS